MEKNLLIASATAIGASALTLVAYRYLSKRRDAENVYETEKLIGEYLIFHYGKPDELLPYGFGPKESLEFPTRCALECIKYTEVSFIVKNLLCLQQIISMRPYLFRNEGVQE